MSAAAAARPGHSAPGRSLTSSALRLTIALGTALLAAGTLVAGVQVWLVAGAVVPALLWVAARRLRPALAADTLLAAFVALAGLGLWLGVGAGWMVPALIAGLAAWDLARLERRLALSGHVDDHARLERHHLAHLLPVLAVGLVLALVSAQVRLRLGFFPALLLGVLAIAGLARSVLYLRRDNE